MLQKLHYKVVNFIFRIIKMQLVLYIFLFPYENTAKCQINSIKGKKYKKLAENYEMRNDYYLAIQNYKKYLYLNPGSFKTLKKLVSNYIKINDFESALLIYNKLINSKSDIYTNTYLRGLCYLNLGNYDLSKKDFEYVKNYRKKNFLKKEAEFGIRSCEFSLKGISHPENITIVHLEKQLNSIRSDLSPVFINDTTLLFSQFDNTNQTVFSIYDTSHIPTGRLFTASYKNNEWIKESVIVTGPHQIDGNITSAALSLNKEKIYFSVCKKDWNYEENCALYVGDFTGNEIINRNKLNKSINQINYSTSHPAVGKTYDNNLEVIYFSSDMPGGRGGMDIWFTVYNKKTNNYSKPKNVGSKINTSKDEITPFYNNETKTLFYASNGKIGFGGFDIYKSTGDLKRWFPSKNIGFPFNTNANDIYFTINEKQNRGFIVSNRKGSYLLSNTFCCYDIYSYTYNDIQQIAIRGILSATLDSTIQKFLNKGLSFRTTDTMDVMEKKYIKNTIVSLYVKDKTLNDSIYIGSDTTNINGEYFFLADKNQDYNLVFYKKNEYKGSIKTSTKSDSIINNIITLNPLEVQFLPNAPLIISNIYYDFNKSELSQSAKLSLDTTLVELLKQKPELIIEISSYTDNKGDSIYNLNLSKIRAENVLKYLISKGISSDRLNAKGYGEADPIAPNNLPDGSDNPEGRSLNRRTEFKIIKYYQNNSF
ncbi:MAG: OmpA family protein [Chlorobi bacterium]|nr:OmpA family protein [Chlorobiota bacterium]